MVLIKAHDMAPEEKERFLFSKPLRLKDRAHTCCQPLHTGVSRGLLVRTTTEHPDILAFIRPVLDEILLGETLFISGFRGMVQAVKEAPGTTDKFLNIMYFIRG